MSDIGQNDDTEKGSRAGECNTLRTSQNDQVYGYLESLTDSELIDDLQQALEHARRLTDEDWTITISSRGVDIRSKSQKRIKIPSPNALKEK